MTLRTGNGWGSRGPSFIDRNFCVSVDTMRAFLPVSIISWAWPAQHSALVRTADVVPRTGSSAVEAALRLPFSPWDWLVVILAFVGLRTAALSWPECSRGDVSLGLDVGVLARLRALILAPCGHRLASDGRPDCAKCHLRVQKRLLRGLERGVTRNIQFRLERGQ